MTSAKLRLAMAAMGKPETNVGELGITRSTLYRHVWGRSRFQANPQRDPRLRLALAAIEFRQLLQLFER
jgi:hypothetical protein